MSDRERIGVIGAGHVGTALAKRLVPQGHEVMLSFTLDEARLASRATSFGAAHGTVAQTVAWADVVALAVPWSELPEALSAAGDLNGKIVWDCTNGLKSDLSGLGIGAVTSGGEALARRLPGAMVVKGIPPFAELLHSDNPTIAGQPSGVFVASDDNSAKWRVAALLDALPASVVDAGDLDAARFIEPAMMLLVRLAYVQGLGSHTALKVFSRGR